MRMKRQARDWKKISATCLTDKRLIFKKYFKKLLQIYTRKTTQLFLNGKINFHLTKELKKKRLINM